jgi:hypothetical protein
LKPETQLVEHVFLNLFQEKTPIKEQTPSKVSIPQSCESCPLYAGVIENKGKPTMVCILRKENEEPIFKYHPLDEAKLCSLKPIYISKPTQRRYESHIEMLNAELQRAIENEDLLQRKDDYYAELRKTLIQRDLDIKTSTAYTDELEGKLKETNRKLKPMEDLLEERDRLKGGNERMANGLLERDEKIAILETDNGYKQELIKEQCERISKLSESEILKASELTEKKFLEENDSLHTQLKEKDKLIEDYALDIQKWEALTKKQKQTLSEAISQMKGALMEFRQFLPTSVEPHAIGEYIRAMQKKVENLEGYLQTIST